MIFGFNWIDFLVAIALTVLLALFGGCAGKKAVDSTMAIQAISEADRQGGQGQIPASMVAEGQDGTIVFPTAPGKNVTFTTYYANGQVKVHLETKRDPIIAAYLSGISGVDAGKFAADAAEREFWAAQLDKIIAVLERQLAMANPIAVGGGGSSPMVPASTSLKDELKQALIDAIRSELSKTGN